MVESLSFTGLFPRRYYTVLRSVRWGACVLLAFLIITAGKAVADDAGQGGLGLLDAVKITIQNQPDILLTEQDVDVSRGKLQVETGAFDTNLNLSVNSGHNSRPLGSLEQYEYDALNETTDTVTTTAGVGKQFRNGISIKPNVSLIRTDIQPLGFATSLDGPSNTATVDFEITIPLLKGRGLEAAAANETSARKNLEASELTLRQAISVDVLNTVQAYWDYVAALKAVKQSVESEDRAKKIADDMRALIAGDEKPAAEMEQVSANLAAKTAARLAGDQRLVDAKHSLGLAMGLPADEIDILQSAQDDFPELSSKDVEYVAKIGNHLVELALQRRADYLGSKKAEESAKVLVVAAKNGLRSQLDLTIGAGYNGLDEGRANQRYITSLTDNVGGYNASIMLTYKWPVENNSARGTLLQREAAYRKSVISTRDLARNIGSNVLQSIAALRNKVSELSKHGDAVHYYMQAAENEKKKFQLGTSTTLDIITTEEHLTSALGNQLAAQAAFAKALVKVRHETGTLLVEKSNGISVGFGELTTLPQL